MRASVDQPILRLSKVTSSVTSPSAAAASIRLRWSTLENWSWAPPQTGQATGRTPLAV